MINFVISRLPKAACYAVLSCELCTRVLSCGRKLYMGYRMSKEVPYSTSTQRDPYKYGSIAFDLVQKAGPWWELNGRSKSLASTRRYQKGGAGGRTGTCAWRCVRDAPA